MAQKIKYSDFTPDQRSCIAGKIPILIKEGKDQDQAIAVAISMCTENQMGHKEESKKLRNKLADEIEMEMYKK